MTEFAEKLSAYLDGELAAADAIAVEQRLETDPAARAAFDALTQADILAQEQFQQQLEPVPFALAQQIKNTDLSGHAAPTSRPIWGAIAAGFVLFAMGGLGGYAIKGQSTALQPTGWLTDIADYHAIYASQGRHLVEVSANESDHIETWLGNTVGASFTIPDLSEHGLTFEGGRLVVANGKPVAQLMYRLPDGSVIALCLQSSHQTETDAPIFVEQTINGFDFVSWTANGADYVVIGPQGQPDLASIAVSAAIDI